MKDTLRSLGVFISHTTIGKLLREMGYSSKKNKKWSRLGKKSLCRRPNDKFFLKKFRNSNKRSTLSYQ
ncbi:MAG: hypothetical protein IJU76_09285 [Desulfovibrionaceae bacterium]|nr:hypothetical protein [Desulfovibrionaceae bacterium]